MALSPTPAFQLPTSYHPNHPSSHIFRDGPLITPPEAFSRSVVSQGADGRFYPINLSNARSVQSSDAASMRSKTTSSSIKSKAKPQYPLDTNQRHVEFILVASFDIDRGSIMEHQYPAPISGDEHMLAELMLPDQAHVRSQDWTIFFLHKDPAADDDSNKSKSVRRRRRPVNADGTDGQEAEDQEDDFRSDGTQTTHTDDEDGDEEAALEGPPLIYVLNLVNTKQDSSVKRGAIVKAMAICTRHPFLHIYKPLLLLALEEYFRLPAPETLASLYDAVNAMDLSLLPKLSTLERIILQASSAKDLFIEKFQRMIEQRKAEDAARARMIEAGQGLPSPNPQRYTLPRDTHDFESRILYNNVSIPVKVPTARSSETVGDFSIIKLIQTFSIPHSTSPTAFALHPHLTSGGPHTHPIIVLVNALLTQKRIIFIGHNMPSGEVAEAVLAACALASGGLLRGFSRHAFPYTDLTKIDDLLNVPGFIAGVTNPAFANKPEWWDLLCDLPTGKMKISSRIETPAVTEGMTAFQQQNPAVANITNAQGSGHNQDYTGDAAFMDKVLANISNRLGEGVIRSMWRDWVVKLTRISAAFEEAVYGASALYIGGEEADAGAFGVSGHGYVWTDEQSQQKELAGNVSRIEGWRNTRSYYSLIQDLAHLYTSRPISSVDLHHHHDRLRTQRLSKDDSAAVYLAFSAAVHTQVEINQLLTVTPETHGGLFYVSLGLFHPQRAVRWKTVELLERVNRHPAGRHFWDSLGRFAKLAYFRITQEVAAAGGAAPDDDTLSDSLPQFDRLE